MTEISRHCKLCGDTHYARGLCKYHYAQAPDQRDLAHAYDKQRRSTPEYREYERARYRRRKNKKAANNALNRAIDKGDIARQPCEVCGNPETHGHHHDYNQPLDVTWLCVIHHAEEHRRGRVDNGIQNR